MNRKLLAELWGGARLYLVPRPARSCPDERKIPAWGGVLVGYLIPVRDDPSERSIDAVLIVAV
ncbi:hypothetical protein GZ198_05560 [Dermatophilus congolensis]|uniref:hypothetical protein n=1 Tax=Dermatophilus congolensis TaxID=1863 RepID=UPI001AAEA7BF|nr:hypothetical protein [Dermatophilus congolensis]MBO3160977.1 hypothetical protein [Dermatophilus congolensis]